MMKLNFGKEIDTDILPKVGLYPPQKVVIYEKGFTITQPRFLRADKVTAYKYEDVISTKIRCCSSVTSLSFNCTLRYRYFVKNGSGRQYGDFDREEDFSSLSQKLWQEIKTHITSRLWSKITSDIQNGKEFTFGRFVVHKDYLKIADEKQKFLMKQINEVKFYLSSEDDAFQIEPKPECKKDFNWRDNTTVYIQHIDNPFLFVKALKMLNIPVNLDAMPHLVD